MDLLPSWGKTDPVRVVKLGLGVSRPREVEYIRLAKVEERQNEPNVAGNTVWLHM